MQITQRAVTAEDREFFAFLLADHFPYKMPRHVKMIIYRDNAVQVGLWAAMGFLISPWFGVARGIGVAAGLVCGLIATFLFAAYLAWGSRQYRRRYRRRLEQASMANVLERIDIDVRRAHRVRWRKIIAHCLLLVDASGGLILVGIDAFGQKMETVPSRIWTELRPLGFGMQNYGGVGSAVVVEGCVELPQNLFRKQPLPHDCRIFSAAEANQLRPLISQART